MPAPDSWGNEHFHSAGPDMEAPERMDAARRIAPRFALSLAR